MLDINLYRQQALAQGKTVIDYLDENGKPRDDVLPLVFNPVTPQEDEHLTYYEDWYTQGTNQEIR
jgi:hypothetical protein